MKLGIIVGLLVCLSGNAPASLRGQEGGDVQLWLTNAVRFVTAFVVLVVPSTARVSAGSAKVNATPEIATMNSAAA